METIASVHHTEDIGRMIVQGLAPITDNRDALVDLGFEPTYPGATTKYERSVWERLVERTYRDAKGAHRRVFVRERAFLKR